VRVNSKVKRSKSMQRSESAAARKEGEVDTGDISAAEEEDHQTQRAETLQAIAELRRRMEDDVAAKETELDRTVQANQAAAAKLDQAEAKEEDLQNDVMDEAELERVQALEGSLRPVRPAGLAEAAASLAASAPELSVLSVQDDDDDDDGPPLNRQSFLALSALFPDVNFW